MVNSSTVYMLDESICQFRSAGLFCQFYCFPVGKQCSPDQMPHDVASDLGLHCLPMPLLRKLNDKNGLRADPILEGFCCPGKQKGRHKSCVPLK